MLDHVDDRLYPLERWSATLLLAAGGVWVLEASLMGVRQLTAASVPNEAFVVTALPALVLTLLGVAGFTPELAESVPRLARMAFVLAAVVLVVLVAQLVWLLALPLGLPNPPMQLLLVTVLGLVVSLALFGGAATYASTPSRTVGVLVVALSLSWVVWLASVAGALPDAAGFAVHVLVAVGTLAAGYVHWTGTAPLDAGGSSPDSTA